MSNFTLNTEILYTLGEQATQWVQTQLAHPSWTSGAIVFLAGLATSLTPCTLSMLPVVVAYMGGYTDNQSEQAEPRPIAPSLGPPIAFGLGLATTLAALGWVAATFGRVYGQIGWGLPVIVSAIALVMGLNLLGLVPVRWPAIDRWLPLPTGLGGSGRAYVVGLTFGLAASPCSTPVLAALLAWVSATGRPIAGAGLLLAYAAGSALPLVLAGSVTGTLKRLLALRSRSGWLVSASGVLLVVFGTWSLLSRLTSSLAL